MAWHRAPRADQYQCSTSQWDAFFKLRLKWGAHTQSGDLNPALYLWVISCSFLNSWMDNWAGLVFFRRRLGWLAGISWSSWEWRHFSKGAPLRSALWSSLHCVQGSTCDKPGRNLLKYSVTVGNWTWVTGRTASKTRSFSDWAIMGFVGKLCFLVYLSANRIKRLTGFTTSS